MNAFSGVGEEMKGWTGKILKIDLSSRVVSCIFPETEVYEKFTGGRGLAGYYLRPFIRESWDSADMPLMFFTGPLCGTAAPASSRLCIMSRSPLTGTVGDSSAGGRLAVEIKKAGYDGIIISGKSPVPLGLEITDSDVKFSAASALSGLTVTEAMSRIKTEGSVAITGPAAENGVAFSNIVLDRHFFAGRNGLGLVMHSKGLRYLSVKGRGEVQVYDQDEINRGREKILRLTAASPVLKGELGFSEYGTGALYDLMHSRRMMPSSNFRATFFPQASELNAYSYRKSYGSRREGCLGCHIQCKHRADDGRRIPEFETMSHFTALIGNSDIETVMEANNLCNELGMDTISAAATISCFMEIEGLGISDLDLPALISDIAFSKNAGAELKYGSRSYAALRNRKDSSITVKGMELPAYDPRGAKGMSLAYALSTRGGCHLRSYPVSHEILRKPVATDRFTFSGKPGIIKISEDMNAVVDSLISCKFLFFAATLEEYAQALYGACGIDRGAEDLLRCGERIYYNERIMNYLNGFDSADDTLPARFFGEPGSSGGGINIPPIDRREFENAVQKYYRIRGLDEKGRPLEKKIKELGLE